MTDRPARRKSAWPATAWTLVALLTIAGGVAVAGEIVSPSVVLDFASLWPLGALALVVGVIVFPWRRRRHRLLALPPLLIVTWLLFAVALHLAGWEQLPSSSALIVGPPAEPVGVGRLDVEMDDGSLTVEPGADAAYRLLPVRRGGDSGPPVVSEAQGEGRLRTVIQERPDTVWYRFAGWDLYLSEGVSWELSLTAPELTSDLTGLVVRRVDASGRGAIALGPPPVGGGAVHLDGAFLVSVPQGVPATVTGNATVPAAWEVTETGSRVAGDGEMWSIEVGDGATVEIVTPG